MDQPSRTDESFYETHPSSLDPSHHFHPSSSHPHPNPNPTPHRPSYSGFHHESPQHGMFQQPSQQHAGFHQQNESQHLREFSDTHDSAFSHHSYQQQDRARVSTLPSNIPHAYSGSHPLAESQQSGGPQSGSHIEPHPSYQNIPRRPSDALSYRSTGTRYGKTQHPNERPQHLDPQQNRGQSQHADNISYRSEMSQRHERSRIQGDPQRAASYRGERVYKEQRRHHGDHMHRKERIHHHTPSTSQFSHKSHSTIATSPSHVGSKSTASGPRSLRVRPQISSQLHSKESLKESVSWSDEDHVQKHKSESSLGSQPRLLLPCSDSYGSSQGPELAFQPSGSPVLT